MRSLQDIKQLEREALKDYIRKLFLLMPLVVLTDIDKARARDLWEKIENAESEHTLIRG